MKVNEALDKVPDVIIDNGTFKYIQIKVHDKDLEKIVIRGLVEAEYHADVLDQTVPQIQALGFCVNVIGGGRIKHEETKKTLHVYGYSIGFGKADHRITVEKLKNKYPNYKITWSDEGY